MSSPINADAGARAALESAAARTFTDAEWERARTRLIELVCTLRDWNRNAVTKKSRSNNVVILERNTTDFLDEAA